MLQRAIVLGVIGSCLVAFASACSVESPTYVTEQPTDGEAGAPTSGGVSGGSSSSSSSGSGGGGTASTDGGAAVTCSADDYTKPDLSTLTACGNNTGHCFDQTKIAIAGILTPCADATKVCVPDEILEADGQPLKSCTSIIGPGGCVTATLIPEIEMSGGGALKQDVCSSTQVCVPCNDPTNNNAPTPFCQPIGVHQNSCGTPSSATAATDGGTADAAPAPLPACCTTKGKSNGVCLPESAIPAAQQSQAPQDSCTKGDKCVPAAFVDGKPVTCDGGAFGVGVCMDKCFSGGLGFAADIGILTSKGCGSTEVCVPCSFVAGQGVPTCK